MKAYLPLLVCIFAAALWLGWRLAPWKARFNIKRFVRAHWVLVLVPVAVLAGFAVLSLTSWRIL